MKKFFDTLSASLPALAPVLIFGVLALVFKQSISKFWDYITGNDDNHKEQKNQVEEKQQTYVEEISDDLNKTTISQSYVDSEYLKIANNIFNACNHYTYENDTAMYNELKKVKNLKDWQKLFVAFGVRQVDYIFIPSDKLNLNGFISNYLDNSHKYLLNNYYVKIGVPAV